jgi:hypothetical protein
MAYIITALFERKESQTNPKNTNAVEMLKKLKTE